MAGHPRSRNLTLGLASLFLMLACIQDTYDVSVSVLGAGNGAGSVQGGSPGTSGRIDALISNGQVSGDTSASFQVIAGPSDTYDLTAYPNAGSVFVMWSCSVTFGSGSCAQCTGAGTCILEHSGTSGNADASYIVTAQFDLAPAGSCPASQPLAHWPMDGTTEDVSGPADGFPLNPPAGIAAVQDRNGIPGNALQFDGTAGFGVGSATTFDNLAPPFSFAVWLYREAGPTSATIFATDNLLNSYYGAWLLWGPNSLGISYGDGGPTASANRRSAAGAQLPTDQWIHIAAVVRGSASTDFSLYVNGSPIAHTYEGSGGPIAHSPSAAPNIGSWQLVTANQPWKGRMDDLRVYDCALDAAGVAALQAPSPAPTMTRLRQFRRSSSSGITTP